MCIANVSGWWVGWLRSKNQLQSQRKEKLEVCHREEEENAEAVISMIFSHIKWITDEHTFIHS